MFGAGMHSSTRQSASDGLDTYQTLNGGRCPICLSMLATLAETLRYCDLGVVPPSDDVMLLSGEKRTGHQLF